MSDKQKDPAGMAESNNQEAEFVSLQGAVKATSLSRSFLYELITRGAIRTFNVRSKDALRGRRLIDYQSLRQYIRSFEEGCNLQTRGGDTLLSQDQSSNETTTNS